MTSSSCLSVAFVFFCFDQVDRRRRRSIPERNVTRASASITTKDVKTI